MKGLALVQRWGNVMIYNWKGCGLLLSNTVYRAGEKGGKKEMISNLKKVCCVETGQADEMRLIFRNHNNKGIIRDDVPLVGRLTSQAALPVLFSPWEVTVTQHFFVPAT